MVGAIPDRPSGCRVAVGMRQAQVATIAGLGRHSSLGAVGGWLALLELHSLLPIETGTGSTETGSQMA